MFKYLLLAMSVLCFSCINAYFDEKMCSQMDPMPLFDIEKFNGIWYGVQSDDGVSACEIFKLKPGKDALSYSLTTETRISTADHKYRTKFIETLTVIDPDFLAKMSVSPLPREPTTASFLYNHIVESNFTVANTDYESYAVVFRSDGQIFRLPELKNTNKEDCMSRAFIWSRTPSLSESFLRKIKKIIDDRPLESHLYGLDSTSNRTGCVSDSVQWST